MKKLLSITWIGLIFGMSICAQSDNQNVGIGTNNPDQSAKLEIESQNQGLLIPRMTSNERKAIQGPAPGLLVYDTDKRTLYMFDGQKWILLAYATSNRDLPPTERSVEGQLTDIGYRVAIGALGIAVADDTGNVFFVNSDGGNYQSTQQVISTSSDPAGDLFGHDLALDGNFLVVGAPGTASDSGRVYIFEWLGNIWNQLQVLESFGSFVSAGDGFGFSVDLSGANLVVGIPFSDPFANTSEGQFSLFILSGSLFVPQTIAFQPGPDFAPSDYFGWDVAIDGVYILVGAPGHSNKEGKAYFYRVTGGSVTLDFERPYSFVDAPNSYYGYSVDIDSSAALIGYPGVANGVGGFHILGNFVSPLFGDEASEFHQYFVNGVSEGSADQNSFFGANVTLASSETNKGIYIVCAPHQLDHIFTTSENNARNSFASIFGYEVDFAVGNMDFDLLQKWESVARRVNGMGISASIWDGRVCVGHSKAMKYFVKDFREE